MNGNISNINHLIHFIIGMISNYFHYLTGLFILYQLIDGFKFKYKVIDKGNNTDDIPLDFLFFSIGELFMRYVRKN